MIGKLLQLVLTKLGQQTCPCLISFLQKLSNDHGKPTESRF